MNHIQQATPAYLRTTPQLHFEASLKWRLVNILRLSISGGGCLCPDQARSRFHALQALQTDRFECGSELD